MIWKQSDDYNKFVWFCVNPSNDIILANIFFLVPSLKRVFKLVFIFWKLFALPEAFCTARVAWLHRQQMCFTFFYSTFATSCHRKRYQRQWCDRRVHLSKIKHKLPSNKLIMIINISHTEHVPFSESYCIKHNAERTNQYFLLRFLIYLSFGEGSWLALTNL